MLSYTHLQISDYLQRGISPHHGAIIGPQQNHPAAPHLADLANYERKRRSEKEAARAARDRSAASRDALRTPPHITRVSASIAASPPMRKMSEPLLNGRPEVYRFMYLLFSMKLCCISIVWGSKTSRIEGGVRALLHTTAF